MDKLKLKIIELVDEGHVLETSKDLQAIIKNSEELDKFYRDLNLSEEKLRSFFNQENDQEILKNIENLIDKELGMEDKKISNNPKLVVQFAIAAGITLFAFNFFLPSNIDQSIEPAMQESILLTDSKIEVTEPEIELEPTYFVAIHEDETLWNKSSELAQELNADRYQVMYALYESNKDAFENSDINKIQYGQELILEEKMIFALTPGEANDIVNRHIYCGC